MGKNIPHSLMLIIIQDRLDVVCEFLEESESNHDHFLSIVQNLRKLFMNFLEGLSKQTQKLVAFEENLLATGRFSMISIMIHNLKESILQVKNLTSDIEVSISSNFWDSHRTHIKQGVSMGERSETTKNLQRKVVEMLRDVENAKKNYHSQFQQYEKYSIHQIIRSHHLDLEVDNEEETTKITSDLKNRTIESEKEYLSKIAIFNKNAFHHLQTMVSSIILNNPQKTTTKSILDYLDQKNTLFVESFHLFFKHIFRYHADFFKRIMPEIERVHLITIPF